MNHAFETDFAFNYLQKRVFLHVGNNLDIDFAIAFINAEDDGFTQRSATAFASDIA